MKQFISTYGPPVVRTIGWVFLGAALMVGYSMYLHFSNDHLALHQLIQLEVNRQNEAKPKPEPPPRLGEPAPEKK